MRHGTNKSTPSFGKRDLSDELLQITMVQDELDGHPMSSSFFSPELQS